MERREFLKMIGIAPAGYIAEIDQPAAQKELSPTCRPGDTILHDWRGYLIVTTTQPRAPIKVYPHIKLRELVDTHPVCDFRIPTDSPCYGILPQGDVLLWYGKTGEVWSIRLTKKRGKLTAQCKQIT